LLIRSPRAGEAMEALLSVGSSEALRSQAEGIGQLLFRFNAAPPPVVARYSSRIALMIPLAFADPDTVSAVRQQWLETLRKAHANLPPESHRLREEINAAIHRLQGEVQPVLALPSPSISQRSPDASFLWSLLRLGTSTGATIRLTARSLEARP